MLPQVIANGIVLSLTYILVAVGLVLIYSIMRVLNLAHGHIYMLGAFGAFYLSTVLGLNFFLALLITMVILGLFGLLLERIVFRPLGNNFLAVVIATVGLLLVIEGAASLSFGMDDRAVAPYVVGVFRFHGIAISYEQLVALGVSLALILGLNFFLNKVKLGQAMRAVAQDTEAAALQGIDINRTKQLAMVLSFALAAAAGVLMAPIYLVNPFIGLSPLIKACIIIVLGGMGSIPGCILGGFILGFVESFVGSYGAPYFALLASFAAFMLILIFRPRGLLGHAE